MTRDDWRQHLAAYADGELDGHLRAQVEAELANDPVAREQVERWRSLRRSANRGLRNVRAPGGFERTIRSSLAAERDRRRARTYRLYAGVMLAAACLFAVVALRLALWAGTTTAPQPISLTPSAFTSVFTAQRDGTPVAGAAFVSDDERKAADQLRKQMRTSVAVPDLHDNGYTLRGVWTVALGSDIQAAHAFYQQEKDAARYVSVFTVTPAIELRQCSAGESAPPARLKNFQVGDHDGISVVKWDEGDTTYALCGPVEGELQRLVMPVFKQVEPRRRALGMIVLP